MSRTVNYPDCGCCGEPCRTGGCRACDLNSPTSLCVTISNFEVYNADGTKFFDTQPCIDWRAVGTGTIDMPFSQAVGCSGYYWQAWAQRPDTRGLQNRPSNNSDCLYPGEPNVFVRLYCVDCTPGTPNGTFQVGPLTLQFTGVAGHYHKHSSPEQCGDFRAPYTEGELILVSIPNRVINPVCNPSQPGYFTVEIDEPYGTNGGRITVTLAFRPGPCQGYGYNSTAMSNAQSSSVQPPDFSQMGDDQWEG